MTRVTRPTRSTSSSPTCGGNSRRAASRGSSHQARSRLRPEGMKRLAAAYARWPVRWRLAGASAALTLLILVVFALVVGRLATNRMRSDFHNELQTAAETLADETTVGFSAGQPVVDTGSALDSFAL